MTDAKAGGKIADLDMGGYAAQVAAEVAARYAVAVSAAAVQVVPLGVSGLAQLVWDGSQLVYQEFKGAKLGVAFKTMGNAKARSTRRGGLVDPAVAARRERLIELHRAQMTDAQIASAMGCSVHTVRLDRRFLMIRANLPPVLGPRTVTQIRMARLADLSAAGASRAEMMADMGISRDVLKTVAKLAGVDLPRIIAAPRVQKPRAPRPRKEKIKVVSDRVAQRAARCEQVSALVAQGQTRRQICAALAISDDTLRRDLEALGLPLPPIGPDGRKTARQLRLAALAAMDVGAKTVAQLAAHFECGVEVMRFDLRELGLKARPDVQCMSKDKEAELAVRRARIAVMVAAGKSQREIIEAEGIALSTLQNDLARLGLKTKRVLVVKPARQKAAPTPSEIAELRAKIKACREQRMSLAEIVEVVGRRQGTVSYHLKKMGMHGQGRRAGSLKSREQARAA